MMSPPDRGPHSYVAADSADQAEQGEPASGDSHSATGRPASESGRPRALVGRRHATLEGRRRLAVVHRLWRTILRAWLRRGTTFGERAAAERWIAWITRQLYDGESGWMFGSAGAL